MAGRGVRRDDAPCDTEGSEQGDTAPPRTITLPGNARSVASGRRFVRETLGSLHPALERVALGVSELATNAIKHTPSGRGGQITIAIIAAESVVRAEVTNDGRAITKPRARKDTEAENGRGILIIETLAEAWGVIEHADMTTVWAEFHACWTLPGPNIPR
jgi:anti-sigma regulatory factor (Ser/Thr protein kinase)